MKSSEGGIEDRAEMLKERALHIAKEIINANILVPQTYGAIRTLGALSILEVTRGDITVQEICEAMDNSMDEIGKMCTKAMHTAHAPFGIVPKYDGKELILDTEILSSILSLFRHHFDIGLTIVGEVLEKIDESRFKNDSDHEKVEMACVYLQTIKDALLDKRLREKNISYRKKVATDNENKHIYEKEFRDAWFQIYADNFNPDTVLFLPRSKEAIIDMFIQTTDPSSLPLDDEEYANN